MTFTHRRVFHPLPGDGIKGDGGGVLVWEVIVLLMGDGVCREVGELVVSVIQGRDLEVSEVTGTIDSYVKVWLTPHKDGRFQTKVSADID